MTNVLLIMADELSTWGLGCMGGPALTPNIDRLAARGLVFTQAYTPSPICVPTRAAIATGRYLHQIGYWSSAEAYDGRIPGWGHALQDAGIPTLSIGKLHYRNTADPTGFDRQIEPIHIPDGIGWVRGLLRQPLASYDATAGMAHEIGAGWTDYTRYDQRVTAEACQWLAAPPDLPWCTFVSYLSPHYPLIAPPEHFEKYDAGALASGADDIPDHPVLRDIAGFFDHDVHFTDDTRGTARAAYYGLCSFLDAQVGQVLAALDASGQGDDTLILFTSDHGEMLGHKGFWGKSTMYDDSARVPLIAACGGIDGGFSTGTSIVPGLRTDPVSLIDLAPTITGAFGLAAEFPGHPLTAAADPGRTVLSEYHDGGSPVGITMVRWDHWKYVHYAQGHAPQLFDLAADPDEVRDLSADRPDVLAIAKTRMAAELDPEVADARAHADQARLVEDLGGREKLLQMEQWNFTPTDSR